MPATISRGRTFGATETVTNTKLHQLVDSATIAGIDYSNFTSGTNAVVRSTSAPGSTDCLWVDTNQSPPVLKRYTGTEWQPTGCFALLTNKSGGSVAAGDVVVADTTTDGSFTTSSSGGDITVIGVAMESISNNADGVIALPGARVTNINCNGVVTRGQFLKTHTVVKQAVATSTADAGIFAIALSSLGSSGALGEALIMGPNIGVVHTAANALSGSVVQVQNVIVNAVSTGTTVMPYDDTIPQNTEGDQYLTLSITPKATTNKLLIIANLVGGTNLTNGNVGTALFQDSTAGALAANFMVFTAAGLGGNWSLLHFMAAGTTSSTAFKIRSGPSSAGTFTLNGDSGNRKFGGVCNSSLTIIEVKA